MITINTILTKSRNPTEYGFRIENRKGTIVHNLGDGYSLIRFDDLLLKKMKTVKERKRKMWQLVKLEWYVHENDFII